MCVRAFACEGEVENKRAREQNRDQIMCACMWVWWVGKRESFCIRRGKEKEKDDAKKEARDREIRGGGLWTGTESERKQREKERLSLVLFWKERSAEGVRV